MEAYYFNYIIPSLIIITIILLVSYYFYDKKRLSAIKRIIAPFGLKQISNKQLYKHIDKKKFSLLSPKIAPVYISEAYQGTYNGYDACIFQVGRPGGGTGSRHYTAVHIKSYSIQFPKFIVKPKDIDMKIAGVFGLKGIEIKSDPEFSRRYYLSGDSESHVRSLFQANIIHFFEQHEGLTFEANGSEFIVFKEFDSAKHEQYPEYIKRALGFIDLFQKGHMESFLIQNKEEGHDKVKKARKVMVVAVVNIFITAIIIAVFFYFFESTKAHLFSTVVLIAQSLFFLFYAWHKKRDADLKQESER